ncbi:non-hydrolyzing UDP-N-acetylglucosamine 2-epimerase [Candidatus Omnitrophota bacterium]
MINVLLVAGARPNFMKIMPLLKEMKRFPKKFKPILIHTGQHYDFNMSASFFKDLDMPDPDIHLDCYSTGDKAQITKIKEGVERVLIKSQIDLVIVVGDVNSTIAAALAASKHRVSVAHVEAGLRSRDFTMPEEINRLLTDHMSDYLFTTEEYGNKNLLEEGVNASKIFFVGDIMVDSRVACKEKISRSKITDQLDLVKGNYCLATIHRPANVDKKEDIAKIVDMLKSLNKLIRVVFPIHPRTRKMLKRYKMSLDNLLLIDPLGYVDFHKLMSDAKFVITDSGGMQEETTVAGIPCITVRTTTERPITILRGTNELIGPDKTKIMRAVRKILNDKWKKGECPPMWDGKTAGRIIKILLNKEGKR